MSQIVADALHIKMFSHGCLVEHQTCYIEREKRYGVSRLKRQLGKEKRLRLLGSCLGANHNCLVPPSSPN